MIKIGNDYEVTADKYQFILNTRSDGKDKDDQPKDVWNKTFHASIEQIAKAIVDKEAKKVISVCSANDLSLVMQVAIESIQTLVGDLTKAIETVK